MLDSNEDTFFDENTESNKDSEQLLNMINQFDKKINFDSKPGEKVTGIITKIGSEEYFIDIQAKNEAIIKKTDFTSDMNVGDEISAYVISSTSSEIILSTKLSAQHSSKQSLFDALNNKIPVQGKVSGVSKDGLTVNLFGQRAFCPISQVDIKFTDDINSFLGKSLDFIVTRVSEGGKNIIVSRIPLLEVEYGDKMKDLTKNIETKKIYTGKITRIVDFGLFIDIGGIEGLAHISELSWEHISTPSEFYTVGQDVQCVVLSVTPKQPVKHSKISLSLKQVFDNPWSTISENFSVGQSVQGKVVRLTNFGAFIELLPGVDGLLHVSEMSWVKRVHHPSDILSVGGIVTVTILSIDSNKKSISLTLKDVASDPWKDIGSTLIVGNEVTGTVAKKTKFGYFIDLSEGITGLLVFSNISADNKDAFKEGDSIKVNVMNIDSENRRISLSFGIHPDVQNHQILQEYNKTKEIPPSSSTSDFGSALLSALSKKGN